MAEVARSVANKSSLTARFFLSSTRLLLEHSVDLQLPEGNWEVKDSKALFVPSSSLRYNYRHEAVGTNEPDAIMSFEMQIVRPLPWVLGEGSNWRTGVRSNLHTELHGHDWVDKPGQIAEILSVTAAIKAHAAASAEYKERFGEALERNDLTEASQVQDIAIREAQAALRRSLAGMNWHFESEQQVKLPRILSPHWGEDSNEGRALLGAAPAPGPRGVDLMTVLQSCLGSLTVRPRIL
jgi:hypothetical protein